MLRAVDTNVLARALIADSGEQGRKASHLIQDYAVFVPESVLLETEWLLRSHFEVSRMAVNTVLSKLLSLPNVHFADAKKVADVLSAHAEGMDFADALHLYGSADCEEICSFDRDFAKRATKLSNVVPVRQP